MVKDRIRSHAVIVRPEPLNELLDRKQYERLFARTAFP